MEYLTNASDHRPQQSVQAFTNKLLALLERYYSESDPADLLEELLLEVCKQTNASGAALFHHTIPLLDLITVVSALADVSWFSSRPIASDSQFRYDIDRGMRRLSCGIEFEGEILWTICLMNKDNGEEESILALARPILKAILIDQERQRKRKSELNQNLNKMVSLQCLIESLDDIVLELSEQTVIRAVWVKDKSKLFMPPELFINKSLKEVFGEFANIFVDCIERLLLTGERQECIYPDFDSTKHHWYCAKFQRMELKDNERRIICVIEDITAKKDMSDRLEQNALELKRMNMELTESKNLAEQVARKRTEILSIMSHEIRTPLNGIIGICNLLNQSLFSDPQASEYLDHLDFSSKHLLHLVNDILDLEKIESRKMELNEKETDLIALIKNIGKQFTPGAEAKGLELHFYHDGLVPEFLMIDDLRLGRILNNLIGNAIKFTERGFVSITLKTLHKAGDQVSILFCVSDTGIGIPEHLHHLIFDKFHQVQQASHREQQGTGLGLSITKGLINLFKSEIHLKSKPQEGTTFEFQIDFKTCSPLPVHQIRASAGNLPDFQLLIVDDNPVNLLVASHQLSKFGIKADQVNSGYAALERLGEKEFDIILIDLHMPGMDGYELSKRVQLEYPLVKVIVFTADILEEVRERLKKIGVYHTLPKPFSPEEMHEILLKVLEE